MEKNTIELLMTMIQTNDKHHNEHRKVIGKRIEGVELKLTTLDKKIDDLLHFRWTFTGIIATISVIVTGLFQLVIK